ncbi:MAG: AAA family ATPase [Euryarchaeota archaeon]|nr:AAA family ATPase [Euryarchaeota archaeon]
MIIVALHGAGEQHRITVFDLLYQVFLELYGEQKTFFFDEIQNVSGWERFVRRIYERGSKFIIHRVKCKTPEQNSQRI